MINAVGSTPHSVRDFHPIRTDKKPAVESVPSSKPVEVESKAIPPSEDVKSKSPSPQEISTQEHLANLVQQAALAQQAAQQAQSPAPGNFIKDPTRTHVDLLA